MIMEATNLETPVESITAAETVVPMVLVDIDSITSFRDLAPIKATASSRNMEGRRITTESLENDELGLFKRIMPLLKREGSFAGGANQAHTVAAYLVWNASPQLQDMNFTVKDTWGFIHEHLKKKGFEFTGGFVNTAIKQVVRRS
jgi:hypothetical protein